MITAAGALALGACVVAPPTGPTVMAMPGEGRNFAQFQQDDYTCRQYAGAQTGYASPAQAANDAAVANTALSTAVGAAAGALIGAAAGNPGAGAAIGAGSGLLIGATSGAGAAGYSGAALQQRYDMAYAQCMAANGNEVPPVVASLPQQGAYYPYGWYSYRPYYGYPAYYGPPHLGTTVVIGGGWGRWHGGWGRPYHGWHAGWHQG